MHGNPFVKGIVRPERETTGGELLLCIYTSKMELTSYSRFVETVLCTGRRSLRLLTPRFVDIKIFRGLGRYFSVITFFFLPHPRDLRQRVDHNSR